MRDALGQFQMRWNQRRRSSNGTKSRNRRGEGCPEAGDDDSLPKCLRERLSYQESDREIEELFVVAGGSQLALPR